MMSRFTTSSGCDSRNGQIVQNVASREQQSIIVRETKKLLGSKGLGLWPLFTRSEPGGGFASRAFDQRFRRSEISELC
jgi:hypothetical protein